MAVKIILREAVEHLGDPGEIVTVANGYARNYLFPKGFALEVTAGNLKMLERRRALWAAKVEQETSVAEKLAAKMSAISLTIEKKAGHGGTLYGSVTKPEIVELLAAQGFTVDRKQIGPDKAIKSTGVYPISVKVHRRVSATVQLTVTPDSDSDISAPEPVFKEEPEPIVEALDQADDTWAAEDSD